jgi:hypothetical protein
MLKELGGATLIGPMLVGLTHSVQICPLGAKDSDVVNMAALGGLRCEWVKCPRREGSSVGTATILRALPSFRR